MSRLLVLHLTLILFFVWTQNIPECACIDCRTDVKLADAGKHVETVKDPEKLVTWGKVSLALDINETGMDPS